MGSPLIVALDFASKAQALACVAHLDAHSCALKIGNELFTSCGTDLVKTLVAKGFRVFLDLKYHDIPNTVANACKQASELGVWMVNLHASGGFDMMRAAREAVASYGDKRPLLIAVTVLTSMTEETLHTLGISRSLDEQVLCLAQLAKDAGLDGVVCSALEVPLIKAHCGASFLTVTPGIRLPGDDAHDQARVVTPERAIELGSDFMVMGRSITRAQNPQQVIEQLNSTCKPR